MATASLSCSERGADSTAGELPAAAADVGNGQPALHCGTGSAAAADVLPTAEAAAAAAPAAGLPQHLSLQLRRVSCTLALQGWGSDHILLLTVRPEEKS